VLGDKLHQVQTVYIPKGTNVSALKDYIKNKAKPAFDHLSSHSLQLWQVSEHV
jgi:hypothetical protein